MDLNWQRECERHLLVMPHIQGSCFLSFVKYASPEQEEEGRKRYEAQKMERLETKARMEEIVAPPSNPGDAAADGAPPLGFGAITATAERMMDSRNRFDVSL